MIVDHPNILKIYDVFEDEAFIHIVAELCTGGELFDQILLKQRYSEREASSILYQLLHAVSHLHSHNISHRDLKPENILFSSSDVDSELKLIDFGLAKKFSNEEVFHSLVGTPYYLAPEVLQNTYSLSCDVWSLGVILFMLLSGEPPFAGETAPEIFENILKGQYCMDEDVWESISSEAKDLVTRTLCVDPNQRITAAEALEHPWIRQKRPLSMSPMTHTVLQRLKRYEAGNQFKREALNVMMRNLHIQELQGLTEVFRDLDTDHTGYITAKELQAGLHAVGVELEGVEIEKIIKKADLAGNGKINYSEFLSCTIDHKNLLSRETKWFAFKYFDMHNEGYLTQSGIKKALKRAKGSLREEEIEHMLQEANLSDRVDFEQFCKIFEVPGSQYTHDNSLYTNRI